MSESSAQPEGLTLGACLPSTWRGSGKWGSQNGWPNMTRLEAISRTTEQLDRCVRERGKHEDVGTRWGVTLGECDWYEELHRLLYEENTQVGHLNDMYAEPYNGPRVAEEIDGRQIARDAIAAARRAHEYSSNAATDDACKAYAGGEIPGSELIRRISESQPPSARFCGCGHCSYIRGLKKSLGPCECSHCANLRPAINQVTKGAPGAGVCVPAKPPTTGMFAGHHGTTTDAKAEVFGMVPRTVTIPQAPRVVRRDALSAGELAALPAEPVEGKCFRCGDKVTFKSRPSVPESEWQHALCPRERLRLQASIPGIGGAPTRATTLPEEPAERKKYPVASGFMDYFPDAIAAVSNLSWKGNEQHNPGQPLHWARGKSTDEADTMLRHFLQRGTVDTDGQRHSVKMAWRALALLQKEIESSLRKD